MVFWLCCSLLLFVLVELFDWFQAFALPLPVVILAGVFLAIVSNYERLVGSRLKNLDYGMLIPLRELDSLPESQSMLASSVSSVEENQQGSKK